LAGNKNPNRRKRRGIFIVSKTTQSFVIDNNPTIASDGVFETN